MCSPHECAGVKYKGTLEDGSVFDENPGGPPLEFEVGSGRVIKGFDEAVRGLKVTESRTVRCEPSSAYGGKYSQLYTYICIYILAVGLLCTSKLTFEIFLPHIEDQSSEAPEIV